MPKKDARIPDISGYVNGRWLKPRPGPKKKAAQKDITKTIRAAYRREAKAKTAHENAAKATLRLEATAKRMDARAAKAATRLKTVLRRIEDAPTPAGAARLAKLAADPTVPETIRAKSANLLLRFTTQPGPRGRKKGETR